MPTVTEHAVVTVHLCPPATPPALGRSHGHRGALHADQPPGPIVTTASAPLGRAATCRAIRTSPTTTSAVVTTRVTSRTGCQRGIRVATRLMEPVTLVKTRRMVQGITEQAERGARARSTAVRRCAG